MSDSHLKISLSASDEASEFILKSFAKKKAKNPKYSIRAFARFLDVDHSHLAKFFNGKSELSGKTKLKCLEKLGAPLEMIKDVLISDGHHVYEEISDDDFEFLSTWTHFTILELMTVPGFTTTPKSVSTRLGISVSEATSCLNRL